MNCDDFLSLKSGDIVECVSDFCNWIGVVDVVITGSIDNFFSYKKIGFLLRSGYIFVDSNQPFLFKNLVLIHKSR